MPLKGRIQPDHIPMNKYTLAIVGMPPLTITEIGSIETEVGAIDMPDRTKVSGGQASTSETEISIPNHHNAEFIAMELWFREGQDPVTATYKKGGVLSQISNSGANTRNWTVSGAWLTKRVVSEGSFENEGEMSVIKYTVSFDDVVSLAI